MKASQTQIVGLETMKAELENEKVDLAIECKVSIMKKDA